ncbi:MAG: triose-phosphate isomerase [Candidatus Peribacteraceae bacterium]|nr:triose-phosphate isomerase [Candidatus Peribacteraceae bacterium]
MSDRKYLIAANWKMNPAPQGALAKDSPYRTLSSVDVWVFPTYLDLQPCIEAGLITGAQLGSSAANGAHTGDVSMTMLTELKCRSVLCGHSERRHGRHETNEEVIAQTIAALEAGLHPIVCVGETAKQREAGEEKEVVKKQLEGLPVESRILIAYEPVWAIGTGKTATPAQAQEMHASIRSLLPKDVRDSTRILYGGSVKPDNAEELLRQKDIDGALVGGASLKPDEFQKIVSAAQMR